MSDLPHRLGDAAPGIAVACALFLALALYIRAWRAGALTPRDAVGPWRITALLRPVLFLGGILAIAVVAEPPVSILGNRTVTFHILQDMVLLMVAPPLLVLGVCRVTGAEQGSRSTVGRLWGTVTQPWIAVLLFNAGLVLWFVMEPRGHAPAGPLLPVEQATLALVGAAYWWAAIDPRRSTAVSGRTAWLRVTMLVPGIMLTLMIGYVLIGAPTTSADPGVTGVVGLTQRADSQIAGLIMLALGNFVTLGAVLALLGGLMSAEEDDEEDEEQDGRPATPAANRAPVAPSRAA